MNKFIEFRFTCILLQLAASQVHKLTRDVLTERMKDIIEIVKLFCIQWQHAKKNAKIPIPLIMVALSQKVLKEYQLANNLSFTHNLWMAAIWQIFISLLNELSLPPVITFVVAYLAKQNSTKKRALEDNKNTSVCFDYWDYLMNFLT